MAKGQAMKNAGLLIMRVGIGAMFIMHGWPKLSGGLETWTALGKAVESVGISFWYPFWGFMAASSEFWGGIFLILGSFFRPACFFMAMTMIVAASMHVQKGDGIKGAAHALEMGIVFFSLFFIGPGDSTINIFTRALKKKSAGEE
ncbi:MAG: DoxX family protein [Candidatus Omnitrophica bacterium]|nr:DoxX family protein [Candidatus Omnitrophota bacterium]